LVGGLACHLDFGFSDTKQVHIVSITHLKFDRKNPLARETEAFCKHRIKRLEKLFGGMASTGAFGRSSRQWQHPIQPLVATPGLNGRTTRMTAFGRFADKWVRFLLSSQVKFQTETRPKQPAS